MKSRPGRLLTAAFFASTLLVDYPAYSRGDRGPLEPDRPDLAADRMIFFAQSGPPPPPLPGPPLAEPSAASLVRLKRHVFFDQSGFGRSVEAMAMLFWL